MADSFCPSCCIKIESGSLIWSADGMTGGLLLLTVGFLFDLEPKGLSLASRACTAASSSEARTILMGGTACDARVLRSFQGCELASAFVVASAPNCCTCGQPFLTHPMLLESVFIPQDMDRQIRPLIIESCGIEDISFETFLPPTMFSADCGNCELDVRPCHRRTKSACSHASPG